MSDIRPFSFAYLEQMVKNVSRWQAFDQLASVIRFARTTDAKFTIKAAVQRTERRDTVKSRAGMRKKLNISCNSRATLTNLNVQVNQRSTLVATYVQVVSLLLIVRYICVSGLSRK